MLGCGVRYRYSVRRHCFDGPQSALTNFFYGHKSDLLEVMPRTKQLRNQIDPEDAIITLAARGCNDLLVLVQNGTAVVEGYKCPRGTCYKTY